MNLELRDRWGILGGGVARFAGHCCHLARRTPWHQTGSPLVGAASNARELCPTSVTVRPTVER